MSASEYEFDFDWYGDVTSAIPVIPATCKPPLNPFDEPWFTITYAIERAKLGDFSFIPMLVDLGLRTDDMRIAKRCMITVGSAGPARCFPPIVERVRRAKHTSELWINGIGSLCLRHWLADVPLFLELYEGDPTHDEQNSLIYYFRDTLGTHTIYDPYDLPIAVEERYEELRQKYGTDEIVLYRGQPYSVARLAEVMDNAVRRGHVLVRDRAHFECATGVDCSSFFKDKRGQPLAAAAILEEFLDRHAAQFQEGRRYFWGHRIPD